MAVSVRPTVALPAATGGATETGAAGAGPGTAATESELTADTLPATSAARTSIACAEPSSWTGEVQASQGPPSRRYSRTATPEASSVAVTDSSREDDTGPEATGGALSTFTDCVQTWLHWPLAERARQATSYDPAGSATGEVYAVHAPSPMRT